MVNLVNNREYSWLIWRDKGRVDGRAAISIVVGVQQRVVVSGGEVADPVGAAGGTVPGKGGLPMGLAELGNGPLILKPVWEYESPLRSRKTRVSDEEVIYRESYKLNQ